jgi:hypothetical protein
MPTPPCPDLPPVTDAHRAAAFESLRFRCCATLAEALADPVRARVVEARAHALRTAEWKRTQATRTTTLARRIDPTTGTWRTQRVATGWADGGTPNIV